MIAWWVDWTCEKTPLISIKQILWSVHFQHFLSFVVCEMCDMSKPPVPSDEVYQTVCPYINDAYLLVCDVKGE